MAISDEAYLELLGILQEECAEVIKAVSKIRRTGRDFKPFGGDRSNEDNLTDEIKDVLSALKALGLDQLDENHYDKRCHKWAMWSEVLRGHFNGED